MAIETALLTFLLVLSGGALALVVNRWVRLPLTLLVLASGMVFAGLVPVLGIDTGIRYTNFESLILYVLIPLLVFEAAINMKMDQFRPVAATIATSATLGVLVSTAIAGAILYYGIAHPTGFPWIAALLAGLVISATDPVAVISQLKDAKAPPQLATLIEGESLFNDATALVLFSLLLAMALGESEAQMSSGFIEFLYVLVGGLFVGGVVAAIAQVVLRVVEESADTHTLISLLVAYGSFYLAEHLLHVSGVVAVLVAALGIKGRLCNPGPVSGQIHKHWELLSLIANVVVFFLMGLVCTLAMFTDQWIAMLLGVLAAFVSRLVTVYLSIGLGKWVFRNPLQWRYAPVSVWGGLRGVITIALVLSLPLELDYWWTIQSIGFGVVLFTLVVQATTNPWLLRRLGLSTEK